MSHSKAVTNSTIAKADSTGEILNKPCNNGLASSINPSFTPSVVNIASPTVNINIDK
jgi:hypothetical protein